MGPMDDLTLHDYESRSDHGDALTFDINNIMLLWILDSTSVSGCGSSVRYRCRLLSQTVERQQNHSVRTWFVPQVAFVSQATVANCKPAAELFGLWRSQGVMFSNTK